MFAGKFQTKKLEGSKKSQIKTKSKAVEPGLWREKYNTNTYQHGLDSTDQT